MKPSVQRPKVCFVLPSLAGGGAERSAVQILNALGEERWERSMYLFAREGPFLSAVSPAVHLDDGAAGRSRVRRWEGLRRFIRRGRPDVVVAFLSYMSVLSATRMACVPARVVFIAGTPVSAFLSDTDYRWSRPWDKRLFTRLFRMACKAADLIIATSQGVADDLMHSFGVAANRVRVVPNPLDLETIASAALRPIEPEHAADWKHPVIVAAGRLASVKNYPLLIEAMSMLRQRTPASLFILGQGEQEAALRSLIEAKGLSDSVHLCGFHTNPWRYIARADVFVLTSRYEGFGNVLAEAMACGVPVVATGSPGTRAIVSEDAGGLLVESHEPSAIAAALERVLGDGTLRARLSSAARQHAEQYRTSSVALAYDRILNEALG
jgi:glycosyltransferase involved in cell wall biosynthesis